MNLMDFFSNISTIIKESAKQPIGAFALMWVILCGIAFTFFRNASDEIKVLIYVSLVVGFFLFGAVVCLNAVKQKKKGTAGEEEPAPYVITPSANKMNKRVLISCAVVIFIALVSWELFWRHQYQYFMHYETIDGIWKGVDPVSSEEAGHLAKVLRFEKKGRLGKPISVHLLNGSGWYTYDGFSDLLGVYSKPCSQSRAVIVKFGYNHKGEISHQTVYDQAHRPIVSMRYTNDPLVARFEYATGASCPATPSGIEAVRFTRFQSGPHKGRIQEEHYLNRDLSPRPKENGHFGLRFEYNEAGRLMRKIRLGYTDQPVGIVETYRYDSDGNHTETAFWDIEGNRIYNTIGVAIIKHDYDRFGNIIAENYLDDAFQKINTAQSIAKVVIKYDEKGNLVEESYFSADDKPILLKDQGYVRFTAEYDERSNRIKTMMYGAAGELATISARYAIRKAIWDQDGNRISDAYFDKDGNPTLSKDGCSQIVRAYNQKGFLISTRYLDTSGQKTVEKYGIHEWVVEYDSRGNRTLTKYFDTRGKPIRIDFGYHCVKTKYDANNNDVEERYFDEYGNPIFSKHGYHRGVKTYDTFGRKLSDETYDEQGRPVADSDGIYKTENKYNSLGQKIKRSYFDTGLQPVANSQGTHSIDIEYDKLGRAVSIAFFNTAGKPQAVNDGYASFRKDINVRGNVISESFFGVDGEPVKHAGGYHGHSFKYNSQGSETERRYFDAAGNLTMTEDGWARVQYTYNDKNYRIRTEYFDSAGRPVNSKDGYAEIVSKRDDRGNIVSELIYDSNRKKVSIKGKDFRTDFKYDQYNRVIEERYFNRREEPLEEKGSAAVIQYTRDDWGRIIRDSNLDADLKPMLIEGGWAFFDRQYNANGHRVKRLFRGVDGKLLKNASGIAVITEKRDGRGLLLEKRYFDESERPCNGNADAPFHHTLYTYDKYGREIEKWFRNLKGESVENENGFHKKLTIYSVSGTIKEEKYYSLDGGLVEP